VLISGGHWDDLQRLISEHAACLSTAAGSGRCRPGSTPFPEDRVASDPWLGYWQGAALAPV
jgi:hypothetical protein